MKEKLRTSAKALKKPDSNAIMTFTNIRSNMALECSRRFEQRTDINQMIGDNNLDMARDNNRNFARFMESIFSDFEPELLVETVLWVFEAYRAHGFQTTYWAANLNIWVDTLRNHLDKKHFDEIYPFYNWLIINIPIFVKLTDQVEGSDSDISTADIMNRHIGE